MEPLNNLSSAFHLLGSNKSLLAQLKPDHQMEDTIDEAEKEIRAHLGVRLPLRLQVVLPAGTVAPKPKFRRQGSRAYLTLNDPVRESTNFREADSDVGLYVPMELIKDSMATPQIGAEILRGIVFEELTALAEQNKKRGWFVKSKPCCIRVYISHDAHVDVTCYVIPEAEYKKMALEVAAFNMRKSVLDSASVAFAEDEITWEEIPLTAHLAMETCWIRSNAKAVHQKIEHTEALKGSFFKRIVRFLKALRDFADDKQGLCSIAITLIVANRLDMRLVQLRRDDLAVYSMLGELQTAIFEKLPTPGNEDVDILEKMPLETRLRLAEVFRQWQHVMHQALYHLPQDRAHEQLQGIFGPRFPDAPKPAEVIAAPAVIISQPSFKPNQPPGNAKSA